MTCTPRSRVTDHAAEFDISLHIRVHEQNTHTNTHTHPSSKHTSNCNSLAMRQTAHCAHSVRYAFDWMRQGMTIDENLFGVKFKGVW